MIVDNHTIIYKDTTMQRILNERLKQSLTDISSREDVTKKVLGFKAKAPLFINQKELLMCIRSYRLENSFYINYFSIKKYYEINHKLIVEFLPNFSMIVEEKHSFYEQIKRCKQVIDFLDI